MKDIGCRCEWSMRTRGIMFLLRPTLSLGQWCSLIHQNKRSFYLHSEAEEEPGHPNYQQVSIWILYRIKSFILCYRCCCLWLIFQKKLGNEYAAWYKTKMENTEVIQWCSLGVSSFVNHQQVKEDEVNTVCESLKWVWGTGASYTVQWYCIIRRIVRLIQPPVK